MTASASRSPCGNSSRAHAASNVCFLFIFVGGVATLASLEITPSEGVRVPWLDCELSPTCQQLTRTGTPCSSCGLTRSVITALHGEFAESRRFHRAGVAIAALLLFQCALRIAFLHPRIRCPALDAVIGLGSLVAFAWMVNGW